MVAKGEEGGGTDWEFGVNVSHSVASDSFWPHGLEPTKLLCSWSSSGKNTEVSSHSLLQGIFPTQGSNLGVLHCGQTLYHWATGKPLRVRRCEPLYTDWINKVLWYSTENYTQYPGINHNRKQYRKESIYVYSSHFATQQKLTQHCKSTVFQ